METNDSNLKPQSTGGLKLMTVFVFVLALHVVVIGGMTTYYLLKGGSTEADMADKATKSPKAASESSVASENPLPETSDKTPGVLTVNSDVVNGTPASTNAPDAAPMPAPGNVADQTPPSDQTPASTASSASSTVASTTPETTTPAPTAAATTTATTTESSAPVASTTPAPASSSPVATSTTPSSLMPPPEPVVMGATPTPAPTTSTSGPTPLVAESTSTTPAPATPAAASTPATDATTYVVKPHDSLDRIAHQNHTTVAKLKAANNLNSDLLHIGQKLVIPATAIAAKSPDASATSSSVAATAPSTTAPTVASTAKVKTAKSTAHVASTSTPAHSHSYTIVKGDTLTKIAHKFKTTPKALMAVNNISDPTKLTIGKQLKIPSKEVRSTATATPAAKEPIQLKASPASMTPRLANADQ